MNLLYMGSLVSFHAQNTIKAFSRSGYMVTALNINKEYFVERIDELPFFGNITNLYEGIEFNNNIKDKAIKSVRRTLNITRLSSTNREIRKRIRKIFRDNWFDVIYCVWGSGVVPEIEMIQEENLKIPIIHELLTYPYNTAWWKVVWENYFYGRVVKNINGRIHCSHNMYKYMDNHFDLKGGKDVVLMTYFSKDYFWSKRLPLLSDTDSEPHIIFIGRTDFSRNRPLDDVRNQIFEISKEKIHIHLAETNANMKHSNYIHTFPRFESKKMIDGSLANFMTQFDACIVLYNINRECDRFRNSLPSRFLFALTAGIPIIMREVYFKSCEEIINRYKIGFSYKNIYELRAMLANKKLMDKYRQNAIVLAPNFTFEKNFHKLEKFIHEVAKQK